MTLILNETDIRFCNLCITAPEMEDTVYIVQDTTGSPPITNSLLICKAHAIQVIPELERALRAEV